MKIGEKHSGYSLVEVLVVISIIMLLSAVFLANMRRGERHSEFQLAMQELGQDFRIMQSHALSSSKLGNSGYVPCGYGVHFDSISPGRYVLFYENPDEDGDCSGEDGIWDDFDDEEKVKLFPKNIEYFGSGTADIYYIPPYLNSRITIDGSPQNSASLQFEHKATGHKMQINVNVLGLVDIVAL